MKDEIDLYDRVFEGIETHCNDDSGLNHENCDDNKLNIANNQIKCSVEDSWYMQILSQHDSVHSDNTEYQQSADLRYSQELLTNISSESSLLDHQMLLK